MFCRVLKKHRIPVCIPVELLRRSYLASKLWQQLQQWVVQHCSRLCSIQPASASCFTSVTIDISLSCWQTIFGSEPISCWACSENLNRSLVMIRSFVLPTTTHCLIFTCLLHGAILPCIGMQQPIAFAALCCHSAPCFSCPSPLSFWSQFLTNVR